MLVSTPLSMPFCCWCHGYSVLAIISPWQVHHTLVLIPPLRSLPLCERAGTYQFLHSKIFSNFLLLWLLLVKRTTIIFASGEGSLEGFQVQAYILHCNAQERQLLNSHRFFFAGQMDITWRFWRLVQNTDVRIQATLPTLHVYCNFTFPGKIPFFLWSEFCFRNPNILFYHNMLTITPPYNPTYFCIYV